jgi:hypothetical protein
MNNIYNNLLSKISDISNYNEMIRITNSLDKKKQ